MGKPKGGGGGKKAHQPKKGGNNKVDERRERQRLRKEERLQQWHDPKWKQEFLRFEAQLKLLNLRIADMTGDGNCLFRSVCDQMEGSPENHAKIRRECVGFLRKFSDHFAPFLDTEDQSFDEYCKEMAQDGEWGGNAELQAMSLGFQVNIIIHQLDKPRWEIVNFPVTQKTIHLSYHNGEHYSSVRPREGNRLPSVSEASSDVASKNKSSEKKSPPVEPPANVSPEVALVMAATDCGDVEMVKQTLVENLYDVQAAINYILLLQETGDTHSMVKEDYVEEEEEEVWKGPSDAEKRTTKWSNDSASAVPVESESLPVYGHGGAGKNKKKGGNQSGSDDPRVALAKRILALEQSKKLSNKDRQELRKLRKEAENRGINVEELANGRPQRGNNNNAPVIKDEDEEEINRLMERIKDLGTIKI